MKKLLGMGRRKVSISYMPVSIIYQDYLTVTIFQVQLDKRSCEHLQSIGRITFLTISIGNVSSLCGCVVSK